MRKSFHLLSKQRRCATLSQQTGQAGGGSILRLELNRWGAICPRDEVVLWEAAGLNVVLKQLLREVLMHLCCFVGINGIATRFVQISQQS